jgi:hypothetical protein
MAPQDIEAAVRAVIDDGPGPHYMCIGPMPEPIGDDHTSTTQPYSLDDGVIGAVLAPELTVEL